MRTDADIRRQHEKEVRAAAREERVAHQALAESLRTAQRDRAPAEEREYRARLARWRAAARALVAALERTVERTPS